MKFTYIEYHVVDHCNLNCAYCCHYSPLSPVHFRSPEEFEKDLTRIKSLLPEGRSIDINLLGGEPFLHPDLKKFIEIGNRIIPIRSIVTNGTLLSSAPKDLIELINDSNISIIWSDYNLPNRNDIEDFLNKNLRVVTTWPKDTMCERLFDFSKTENTQLEKYNECCTITGGYGNCVTLRDGYLYRCSTEAWVDYLIEYFGLDVEKQYKQCDNRIDIYSVTSLSEIEKFINTPSDLCTYCTSSVIRKPWRVSRKEIGEWVKI